MSLYDQDTFAWAMQQADAVRRRAANEIDWDNVAEEIESLGNQQRSELRNRYVVLLTHLLKWLFQPERRTRSWTLTIAEQRVRLKQHLRDNPSLGSSHAELFTEAYERARLRAAREMRRELTSVPEEPPFTSDQARDPDWLPGENA